MSPCLSKFLGFSYYFCYIPVYAYKIHLFLLLACLLPSIFRVPATKLENEKGLFFSWTQGTVEIVLLTDFRFLNTDFEEMLDKSKACSSWNVWLKSNSLIKLEYMSFISIMLWDVV